MGDPFKTYEAARKSMYAAMEKESSEPSEAANLYSAATSIFATFLQVASKNRGMYRELVRDRSNELSSCFDSDLELF